MENILQKIPYSGKYLALLIYYIYLVENSIFIYNGKYFA
jgi:hypothetical protein